MKIHVKKIHIKQGNPNSPYYCPVALAIAQQCKIQGTVTVVSWQVKIGSRRILLPQSVQRFIRRFDNKKKFSLFRLFLTTENRSNTVGRQT